MNTLRVILSVLLFPACLFAQTLDPAIRVDSNGGSWPHAVYHTSGVLYVVYSGDYPNRGVYARRYDTSLQLIGQETAVNDNDPENYHLWPKVGCFSDGGFVVAWERELTDPYYSPGMVVRRFDNSASPASGVIEVPHYLQEDYTPVDVLTAPDGGFEVFWYYFCPGCYGSNSTPSYTFDADNNPGDYRSWQMWAYLARPGRVAGNIYGNTVGVFDHSTGAYHEYPGLTTLRLYRGDISGGLDLGTEIFMDTTCTSYDEYPDHVYDVSINSLGEYVLAWENDTSIRCQRFDAAGNTVGPPFPVAVAANALGIAMNDSGDFVVAWRGAAGNIFARCVTGNNTVGERLTIGDSQEFGNVCASPDGRFAVCYHSSELTTPNDWTPFSWVRQIHFQTVPVTFSVVTAENDRGAVVLRWDLYADEAVETIRVNRSDRVVPVATLDGDARGYTDTGVEPGCDYVYTVTAVKPGGEGVESRPVRVSVPGTSLELAQNEPNPFNPATTIGYSLDRTARVSIEIYSALGQLVRAYDEGIRPAGRHSVSWDGRDAAGDVVASGVYLYVLRAGSKRISKKMTLLK